MNDTPHDLSLPSRPRRNRRSDAVRGLVRETRLSAEQFIYPLFLQHGGEDTPIDAMPGCTRYALHTGGGKVRAQGLLAEIKRAAALGVRSIVLFPRIDESLKSPTAEQAFHDNDLVPTAIKLIKDTLPDTTVITDVALDPYNSDGHDGIVADEGADDITGEGRVLNDATVNVLRQQALCHARAGADIVAPSDMMDGRVGAIRQTLDAAGFTEVAIMAYTAKYASAFYGPFRGALDSAPKKPDADGGKGGKVIPKDKAGYQMDPANAREAVRELQLDEAEGADVVMVKPAGPYLDVIRVLRENTTLPVAAYQVSGEYLMIKAACAAGWLDERAVVMETLTGIVRAGADMVLTYFAPQAAMWLAE